MCLNIKRSKRMDGMWAAATLNYLVKELML